MKTIVASLIASLLVCAASSGSSIVFSQDPANHAVCRVSDWSDDKQKGDDFTLTGAAQIVTRVRWWGSYGANPDPAVDSFVFKFFAEDPTTPGFPDISCMVDGTRFPRSSAVVDFSRTATNLVSNSSSSHDGGMVYEYSAILDVPIHLEADKRYWLAVTNSTPTYTYPPVANSKWGWLESSGGGSQWYRAGHCPVCADDWAVSYTNNLAFALESFQIVGISNRTASDPIFSNASSRFLLAVWGKARITGEITFELDDGSGHPISVEAPGFAGFVDGDYVRATGLLSYSASGSVLKADADDVVKAL